MKIIMHWENYRFYHHSVTQVLHVSSELFSAPLLHALERTLDYIFLIAIAPD